MVGMVGLAPTEAVRPGDLQSPAIAAMRHTQIGPPEWTRTTILRLSSAGTTLSYRRGRLERIHTSISILNGWRFVVCTYEPRNW